MNLRIIAKNHAADPVKGFLTKSISKPNGRSTAMPTAWELGLVLIRRYKLGFIIGRKPTVVKLKII